MATLLLTAVGTIFGGPLGGALGALAGSQIDGAIFGGSSANREGRRLKDLSVTTSSYGSAVPRHFGRMRVAGTIIWATDLTEAAATSGGGKNQPSVITYSYTTSFAVALASRPIVGVGRVWADGSLLRGAAGDLKVGGAMRLYTGNSDQAIDPLIASAEGVDTCPAFRGLAYVVFQDLQLADFGNRIPSLTFEVFADDGTLSLASLFDGVLDEVDADVPLGGIIGYSCEGSLSDTLAQFQTVIPMLCDAGGGQLTIRRERLQTAAIALGEPAVSASGSDFGGKAGYTRKRQPDQNNPPRVIRYYDVALDYQPGTQRAPGRPTPGQPRTVEVPATMIAAEAFALIAQANRNAGWAQDTMSWRCAELNPAIAPGAVVTVPDQAGQWRVTDWEWRDTGVELTLERLAPAIAGTAANASAGLAVAAADVAAAATAMTAFELPWDGTSSADVPAIYAAVSSAGAGWSGAALYADDGGGSLRRIGASGRARSTIGTVLTVLPVASPLLYDRVSTVTVQLLAGDMALTGATALQMANGGNRALIGSEMIQFGTAVALGGGQWRLEQLLRGRGGTEDAINGHVAGEAFVLIDEAPVALDPSLVGTATGTRIAAIGLADTAAVEADIACRGLTWRPLSPVYPGYARTSDGGLTLNWVRRARGSWVWQDGIDVPLQEQSEAYQISFGPAEAPLMVWQVGTPQLSLSSAMMVSLATQLAGGAFWVRQIGTHALSPPLLLGKIG